MEVEHSPLTSDPAQGRRYSPSTLLHLPMEKQAHYQKLNPRCLVLKSCGVNPVQINSHSLGDLLFVLRQDLSMQPRMPWNSQSSCLSLSVLGSQGWAALWLGGFLTASGEWPHCSLQTFPSSAPCDRNFSAVSAAHTEPCISRWVVI